MPIVSSGEIALIADIEAEYDQTGTTDISLLQARDDAGLGSGQVAMTQFYSLSDVVCSTNDLSNYSSLASTSVTLNGEITNTGGGTFTDKGFYVGTSSTATNNTKYSYGSGGGSWSQSITGLSSGTTYYVRSYTVSEAGECLGTRTVSFATTQPSLSSHLSFSQTGGGGSSWEQPSSSFSFGASSSWSANSNSYTGYAYTGASNGASHGWSGFYVGGVSTSSYGYQNWSKSGSGYNGGTVYGSGRNPTTGGYAGGYISFSKSGYSGFGITCAQRNFSYSDIRLKTNISLVGKSKSGLNIYTWNYIDSKYGIGTFKGVMAQEVPDYARTKDAEGFYMVDYSKLDVKFEKSDGRFENNRIDIFGTADKHQDVTPVLQILSLVSATIYSCVGIYKRLKK